MVYRVFSIFIIFVWKLYEFGIKLNITEDIKMTSPKKKFSRISTAYFLAMLCYLIPGCSFGPGEVEQQTDPDEKLITATAEDYTPGEKLRIEQIGRAHV